jgi:histidinol-phosphatase (PHP family)
MIETIYAVDYHMHSFRSHDGKASIMDQCQRAVEIGLDEIGFTEHKDFNPDDPVVNHFDYNLYMEEIEKAKQVFTGKLVIRAGVELDYQYWFEESIGEYLQSHTFDFLVSSVHHTIDGMIMSPEFIHGRSRDECYSHYFREVIRSVQSGYLDVVGHLEYANRRGTAAFGPYDPSRYKAELTELFDLMIDKGVALEINTAGLRQGISLTYPCEETVALYRERGGKLLTIGSDAHKTADLGKDYMTAVEIAMRLGWTDITIWENRAPHSAKLECAG